MSSTKAISGHSMTACGAHEAIYTLLMLCHNFIAPTVNLENIALECSGINHVTFIEERELKVALTFNAGLGGANACLIFRKS